MSDCQTYEALIAEKLFGELRPEDQQRLNAHLAECPACAAEVQALEATLEMTSERTRSTPPPAFWDNYYDRLAARLEEETSPRLDWKRRLAGWADRVTAMLWSGPRWQVQLATAVAFVVVGIGIGWLLFGGSTADAPLVVEGPVVTTPTVEPTALETRTSRYLERSKVLLLGLVNFEPDHDNPSILNLDRKQEIARELVHEASVLKEDLSASDQQRLRELIADLEVILMQIANLEAGHDLPAIELVQRGVDRRAILLKINLTEMSRPQTGVRPVGTTSSPSQ